MDDHSMEIKKGERFEFGKNWRHFFACINEDRILEAERSLKTMLSIENLEGKSFLDIGSGSGLFSLAARRLGARVHSFDYDPQSVACTHELKRRYFPNDSNWTIGEGSALDTNYLSSLGTFDVVYSWGVLHHTGDMWKALQNSILPVASSGKLFIAIYNDQGGRSKRWRRIKQFYCSGMIGKCLVKAIFYPWLFTLAVLAGFVKYRNPLGYFMKYRKRRGMSIIRDWDDWLGGYPFEVAKPEEIFSFYRERGFVLEKLKTCGGRLGCNEFVFVKGNV